MCLIQTDLHVRGKLKCVTGFLTEQMPRKGPCEWGAIGEKETKRMGEIWWHEREHGFLARYLGVVAAASSLLALG